MRMVTLPVRVQEKDVSRTLFIMFLVVRDLTTYNVIHARPTVNHVKVVIVTHFMVMKFECDKGKIGTLYGDQQETRECYLTTLKPSSWKTEEKDQTQVAREKKIAKIVKDRVASLRMTFESPQTQLSPARKTSEILLSKKTKYVAVKEEPPSS